MFDDQRPTTGTRNAGAPSGALFDCNPTVLGEQWAAFAEGRGAINLRADLSTLTEARIVRETIWMLSGADTFVYTKEASGLSLVPRAGVTTTHTTPGVLSTLLAGFAKSGTFIMQLLAFGNVVFRSSSSKGRATRTFEAFAAWINEFVQRFQLRLIRLERAECSLLELSVKLRAESKKLRWLHRLFQKGVPAKWDSDLGAPNHSAKLANGLLSVLFTAAFETTYIAENEDLGHFAASVFASASKPLLDSVDLWIFEGALDDPCDEFPIVGVACFVWYYLILKRSIATS
jgi:hypothetical protein